MNNKSIHNYKFVTLFDTQWFHLSKDVGAIPQGLKIYNDIDSYITVYNGSKELTPAMTAAVGGGIKIENIKQITGKFNLDACVYLIKASKNIDILNLYHVSSWPAIHCLIYKVLNKKGKVYLKCDSRGYTLAQAKVSFPKQFLYRMLYKKCDVMSAETEESRKIIEELSQRKVILLPNPIFDIFGWKDWRDRKNQITTCARLGAPQKDTETLVLAFARIHRKIPDWKLILYGSATGEFVKFVEKVKHKDVLLKDKIILAGEISDRAKLRESYLQSKIFVMPSRYESFGISFLEASATGNYLIGTNLPSFAYITNDWKYGKKIQVGDDTTLGKMLVEVCLNEEKSENTARNGYKYVMNEFSMKRICNMLCNELQILEKPFQNYQTKKV